MIVVEDWIRSSKEERQMHLRLDEPCLERGTIYYGWRELQEATGVSKDLYRAHYLRGFDPEPRIGKDGPQKKDQLLQPLARRV